MKTAIATISIGESKKIHELTIESHYRYALKLNAIYSTVESTRHRLPHFAKFDILVELANQEYDRVLYVDADVYIKRTAPDIFEQYPTSALFSEVPHPRQGWLQPSIDWIRKHLAPDWPDDRYFNTGVMVFNGESLQRLAAALRGVVKDVPGIYFEQEQLNVLLDSLSLPEEKLDQKWNQFCGPIWIDDKKAKRAHFLHGTNVQDSTKYQLLKRFSQDYP